VAAAAFLNALTPAGYSRLALCDPRNTETGRLQAIRSAALRAWRCRSASGSFLAPGRRWRRSSANAPFSSDDPGPFAPATAELKLTELVSRAKVRLRVAARPGRGRTHDMAALTPSYHIDLPAPTDDRPFLQQLVLADWASSGAQECEDGCSRLAATKTLGVIVLLRRSLV
jgi:hypothetical protein